MSAELLHRILLIVSLYAWLVGLTLAEFAKLYALGLVVILVGVAAAGGAASAFVIVRQRERQSSERPQ